MPSNLESRILELFKTAEEGFSCKIDLLSKKLRTSAGKVRKAVAHLIESGSLSKDSLGGISLPAKDRDSDETSGAQVPATVQANVTSATDFSVSHSTANENIREVHEETTTKRRVHEKSKVASQNNFTGTTSLRVAMTVIVLATGAVAWSSCGIDPRNWISSGASMRASETSQKPVEPSPRRSVPTVPIAVNTSLKPEIDAAPVELSAFHLRFERMLRASWLNNSAEDWLRAINTLISEGEALEPRIRCALIREILAELHLKAGMTQFVLNRGASIRCFEKAISYMEKVHAEDPKWRLAGLDGLPDCECISVSNWTHNARILRGFVQIMDANAARDGAAIRDAAKAELRPVRNWLETDQTNSYPKVQTCQRLAVAMWCLGESDDAIELTTLATNLNGNPTVAKSHSRRTQQAELETLGLRSVILATDGREDEAMVEIQKATEFASELRGEDNQGVVGTLFLIHALNCSDVHRERASLNTARNYFRFHSCESCLFGDSYAAARLAEFEEAEGNSEAAARLRDISAYALAKAIPMYRIDPIRLDVDLITSMPSLRKVLDMTDPMLALDFEWEPDFRFEEIDPSALWFHLPPYQNLTLPFHRKLSTKHSVTSTRSSN